MQDQINKPIFVVGSPRSGTSILAWCLGHHPNLFPVPESSWMGEFAISVAIAHQTGAARGDYSILSAMEIGNDELFATFGQSINDLILRHRKDLERKRETRSRELKIDARWLEATSMSAGPKERWVDGTPEYSFHICGLRKLFPNALFVHIFRDVHTVVRSMLNFRRVSGIQLVPNEQEAYRYWLRTVSACVEAERAYGPNVVYRIRYADLINNAELAMRSLFAFLQEPYAAKCLEPLAERINSSEVPSDFRSDDPATDPAIIEAARRLCAEIENNPQPADCSQAVADKMEKAFSERVKFVATLDNAYHNTKYRMESTIAELRQQIENLRNQLPQAQDHAD
jgi:Sulfotransferase family